MLQTIRDKITGWFAIVFLSVIAVVFIFGGVYLSDMTASSNFAVKVNGERIPSETVLATWQRQQQQLQQTFRGEIPEPIAKAQQDAVLDFHIRQQLLTERAEDLGYRISDAAVMQALDSAPVLQVDGKFSRDRYKEFLRQQNRTEPQFEAELRRNLAIEQLQNGIAGSAFVTPLEMARQHALQNEQREIDYVVIQKNNFLAAAAVSDAEIQAWYDSHKADYVSAETVDLEFVQLNLADVEQSIQVTDEALKAHYETAKDKLTTPERRLGRHILLTVEEGKDDAATQKAAEEVLAKLRAGADFAALAKQYSKDPGSAEKGGDLGWASKGMFVGPFEEALFSMQKGELRGPIKTQFGYHILRLDDSEGGQTKSFEEARAELEKDYRTEQAQARFYDQSQKLADDAFSNLADLQAVAQKAGLPLQRATGFTRQGGAPLGADPKIIAAAFDADAIKKGENSPLISLGDDRAMVLRVAKHHPATQLPIAAVRTQIEAQLRDQAARAAAAKQGVDALTKLQAGAAWTAIVSELKQPALGKRLLGRTAADAPAEVRDVAFKLPRTTIAKDKPQFQGAAMDSGDYVLVAVTDVVTPVLDINSAEGSDRIRQARQVKGGEETSAYVADIESEAKIVRNPKLFE